MAHIRIAVATAISALIVSLAVVASAQESTVAFPVAELGNCASKSECHKYCDDLANIEACVDFAKRHNLMSEDDARHAREFARLGGKGPGGCTSKEECENYCEDPANMRTCINFAREAGMMRDEELAEAEKVAKYVESGGEMPGGCRGEKQCRSYCEDSAHGEECVAFAQKAGFMSEKEVEIFRKTGGKGPGGCSGRACEAHCSDEANREACIAFAMEHDLMSAEDKQMMEDGKRHAMQALEKAPPEVLSCIEAKIGAEKLSAIRAGTGFVGPQLGQILPQCFRDAMGGDMNRGPFGPGSEAQDCMRKVFGDDFEERVHNGEIDPGARDNEIRECMQSSLGDGFLNDAGRWERPESGEPASGGDQHGQYRDMPTRSEDRRFGPPEGADHDAFETKMREQYGEEFDARRAEMEARMRAEIESQMRSGEFDRSKLPADFRPEGMMPPPESFNRPPEGDGMRGEYPRPSDGMMPPEGMPAEFRPEGGMMPPPEMHAPPPSDAPQSRTRVPAFIANAISIFQSVFIGK